MKVGVYAGSFDPITKGHQDVIERALKIVDKMIILVLNNPKKTYWFNIEERKKMAEKIYSRNKNVEIKSYAGLLVDFMKENSLELLIKGVRDIKDFSEEMTYFYANKELSDSKIDTIFIPSAKEFLYVSSTFVKEMAFYEQDLSKYVDKKIVSGISKKLEEYRRFNGKK